MASKIDPALAKSLIQEYQKQNTSPSGPALKTPDGQFLNGFIIDRVSLEAILADPTITGIKVNFAKQPDGVASSENIFTIIFHGVVPNPAHKAGTNIPMYSSSGDPYEYVDTCPPHC